MTALTRRRDREAAKESWQIFYGDVRIGTVSERSGAAHRLDCWEWACGFASLPAGSHKHGTAVSLDRAKEAFEEAWRELHPRCTEAQLQEQREQDAWTAWKYRMFDSGRKLPTATETGWSKCFCGADIDNAGTAAHIKAHHMDQANG